MSLKVVRFSSKKLCVKSNDRQTLIEVYSDVLIEKFAFKMGYVDYSASSCSQGHRAECTFSKQKLG